MNTIRVGLIQVAFKGDPEDEIETIRERMLEAHLPFLEQARSTGVQILCLQELFAFPYFCPSQDPRWYRAAERVPDGPTTRFMIDFAKRSSMVIVAPLYEEEMVGVYYNTAVVIDADGKYLGKYRKTHLPQVAGFYEKFFFRPGNSGWPVFNTAYCRLGVYICYDRHFPEGWRALALNGAEYVVNPSATVDHLSGYLWKLEQPAAAVANGIYIGAVNRPGREYPWNIGRFYGSSYVVNPRGEIIAQGSEDNDELVVADIDLDMIREVRETWQFFRDRRPETYEILTRA